MKDHELEVGRHAILMKGLVRTDNIDLTGIRHFVNDLVEQQAYPVISLESKFDAYEEALFWNNSIDRVFTCEWTIYCVNVKEPEDIGTLRPLFKYGIDDI